MSEKLHNVSPTSASEYERALNPNPDLDPAVIQYQHDWEMQQKSQPPAPIERPQKVEVVQSNEPQPWVDVSPTAEAREQFNEFVEYRNTYPQRQEALRQLAIEQAPRGVRGTVTRLTNWWRARQDRLAVPSYTRPAPWLDVGVVGVAGNMIDRQ